MLKRTQTFVLALFLVILAAVSASAANYSAIENLTSNRSLGGTRSGYTMSVPTQNGEQITVDIVAHLSGTGGGSQVFWTQSNENSTSTATVEFSPSNTTTIAANGESKTTVTIKGSTTSDVITVTAALQDSYGTGVAGAANATVRISFVNAKPIAGITLPKKVSIREDATSVTLKATPDPLDATDVSYTWMTSDSSVIAFASSTTTTPEVSITPAKIGSATVQVTASGANGSTAAASCDLTVVAKGELADDMIIEPSESGSEKPSTPQEGTSAAIIGVDTDYLGSRSDTAYQVTPQQLREGASIGSTSDSDVKYLVGTGKVDANYSVNRQMIASAQGLNVPNYDTNVAAALRLSIPGAKGSSDMVPIRLSYNFKNLLYPDGKTAVKDPTSAADFQNSFRIKKYFGTGQSRPSIDISDILAANMGTYMVRDTSPEHEGRYLLAPTIVIVNHDAPLEVGGVRYADADKKYGARFVKDHNILYIYNGFSSEGITDPILVERVVPQSGGGGGCAAGAAAVALIALAIFKKKH